MTRFRIVFAALLATAGLPLHAAEPAPTLDQRTGASPKDRHGGTPRTAMFVEIVLS